MEQWTGYHITMALATIVLAVGSIVTAAVGLLRWFDRRNKIYRIATRAAIRSLMFSRIELYDAYLFAVRSPNDPGIQERLLTLLVHLDNALGDAEDMVKADVAKVRDQLRLQRTEENIRLEDVVGNGEENL